MRTFYFDFETVARPSAMSLVKPRGGLKDPVKIQESLNERIAQAALNINLADIVVASWATNDGPIVSMTAKDDAERKTLLQFFWDHFNRATNRVGFNCIKYDLGVAVRNSQLLFVDYPRNLSFRKYSSDVIDLYQMLTNWGEWDSIGLQAACRLFGRPGETETSDGTGAEVAQWIAAGDYEKVVQHCEEDVQRTRWLAQRLKVV